MELNYIAGGTKVPLFGNPYFDITNIDGFTAGNVSISSSTLADTDGDIINAQRVNARDITITLRFKDGTQIEEAKRYLLRYFKLKKEAVLELDYNNRTSRITGHVQDINIPRFERAVTAQISIHCASPFWIDVSALEALISNVTSLHHWPIHPTAEEPIIMGAITNAYQAVVINDGDVDIGMIITIVAEKTCSNPRVMLDLTDYFFEVNVTMQPNDELIINTNKGQKSITLNGESIMNKIVAGSTWLQLAVGNNTVVCTNSSGGDGMLYSVKASERYL